MSGRITVTGDPGGGWPFLASCGMNPLKILPTVPRHFVASRVAVTLVLALGGSAAAVAVPSDASSTMAPQTGADLSVSGDAAPGSAVAAAQALAAIGGSGGGGDAASWIDALPAGITGALGYRPVVVDGLPSDPAGDCSSPVPLPQSFTPACLTHDLGYDLLRVADADGESIPRGVRPALDRQLAARMEGACTGEGLRYAGCRVMAGVADAAVTANSWRQNDGAPVKESWPWS